MILSMRRTGKMEKVLKKITSTHSSTNTSQTTNQTKRNNHLHYNTTIFIVIDHLSKEGGLFVSNLHRLFLDYTKIFLKKYNALITTYLQRKLEDGVKIFANIKKMYYLCTALHLLRALHIESVFAVLQENVEVFKNDG